MSNQDIGNWPANAPSPEQLARLFAQIQTGEVTGNRIESLLTWQEPKFEKKFQKQVNMPLEALADLTHFWDEQYPGHGESIVRRLAPFYSPNFRMHLQPPASDLTERAMRAFAWFKPNEVCVIHDWCGLSAWWRENRYQPYPIAEERTLPGERIYREVLIDAPVGDTKRPWFNGHLFIHRESVTEILQQHFRSYAVVTPEFLCHSFFNSLWVGLITAVLENEDQYPVDLLDLWLTGNFPVFCTLGEHGTKKVYVLCAS